MPQAHQCSAGIKALYSVAIFSRLVGQCRNALSSLSAAVKITFLWVACGRKIEENERASRLARLGLPTVDVVSVSLAIVKGGIYSRYLRAADFR